MYEDEGSFFWDDERQAHEQAERSTTPEQHLMNDIQVLREMVYDLRKRCRKLSTEKETLRTALRPFAAAAMWRDYERGLDVREVDGNCRLLCENKVHPLAAFTILADPDTTLTVDNLRAALAALQEADAS